MGRRPVGDICGEGPEGCASFWRITAECFLQGGGGAREVAGACVADGEAKPCTAPVATPGEEIEWLGRIRAAQAEPEIADEKRHQAV